MRRCREPVLLYVALLALTAVLTGCSDDETDGATGDDAPGTSMRGQQKERSPTATTGTPTATATTASATPSTAVAVFDRTAAMRTVRDLAAGGPREATSPAYRRAGRLVADRLRDLGYQVALQRFRVPAGESWGVPVGAGRSYNVVATAPGFDPRQPHVVIGAHLDTVPQAPGAEDNASGVAVLLETARLAAEGGTRLPVVFVAFGAEEPRGPADDEHHFGSLAYVQRAGPAERAALRAMVALDRVGAPGSVPVCTGGLSPLSVRRQLLAAADRAGVPARPCENRTSDHWPFEKAGEQVARLGGNDSPGYHSPADVPRMVSPRQLDRVGRTVWEWLRAG